MTIHYNKHMTGKNHSKLKVKVAEMNALTSLNLFTES